MDFQVFMKFINLPANFTIWFIPDSNDIEEFKLDIDSISDM